MLQRGVQLWEIRGSFAHLLNYRCHKCKGKLAAVRTGARRTDGFTDTVEGAENPCTRGGVKMCVWPCVCACTLVPNSIWNQVSIWAEMLSWSSAKITSSCPMPALLSFFFFWVNVTELVCYLNMGDWSVCHTRGCPSGDCKRGTN